MTRPNTHWLLTLPVVLAGIEAAHALANSLTGAPASEVFESAASGRGALEPLGLLLLAMVTAALVARMRGGRSQPRNTAIVAAPFALLPPVGFALLELGEALASGHALLDRTFALGLTFQLPVALLGYLLARGLLRLSDELRALVLAPLASASRSAKAASCPRAERPSRPSGLRHLPRAGAALRARPDGLTPPRRRPRTDDRRSESDEKSTPRRGRGGGGHRRGARRRPRRRGVPVPERHDRRGPGDGGDEHDVRRRLLAERRRRRLPQRRRHAHLLHQRGQGGLGLRARRAQRDHRQAVRPGRRHLREDRCRPDRLEVREVPLPRVHRRHVHAPAEAARRRGLPRLPRARDPGAGRRHDPRRLPQHLPVPRERASPRRPLREETARAPRTTTARAAPTRPTTPCRPGGRYTYVWRVPERAGPRPATRARSCGCTTRTRTRSPTRTRA